MAYGKRMQHGIIIQPQVEIRILLQGVLPCRPHSPVPEQGSVPRDDGYGGISLPHGVSGAVGGTVIHQMHGDVQPRFRQGGEQGGKGAERFFPAVVARHQDRKFFPGGSVSFHGMRTEGRGLEERRRKMLSTHS